MGVYAQTDFEIICKTSKIAKKVAQKLKEMTKKSDENDNTFGHNIEVDGNVVYGKESSGRFQNLEYRCEIIWNSIKGIVGVEEMNAPFMIEGDGMYFSKDDED